MPKMPDEKVLFSTATVSGRTRRMVGMKSNCILAVLTMSGAIPGVTSAAAQPLDFNFRVS